ncbi:MAG: YdcH family protein [Pseudomonadota bacterium]
MSVSAHIQELRKKHQTLSEQVEQEQRSPGTDALRIAELKKRKLQIKEEITRLSQA